MNSKEIKEDLERNEIAEGSVAEGIYRDYLGKGFSHKEAVKATVDGIRGLKSSSFDEPTLEKIKSHLSKIKGQWF